MYVHTKTRCTVKMRNVVSKIKVQILILNKLNSSTYAICDQTSKGGLLSQAVNVTGSNLFIYFLER